MVMISNRPDGYPAREHLRQDQRRRGISHHTAVCKQVSIQMQRRLTAINHSDIHQRLSISITERAVQEAYVETCGRIPSIQLHSCARRWEAGAARGNEFRHSPAASPKTGKCIDIRPDANGELVRE